MVSDSIPLIFFSDESINRDPVCEFMHSIERTPKILTFMPATKKQNKNKNKTKQKKTHPACTIHEDGMWLPLRLDSNWSQTQTKILTNNGEPQRYSWERRRSDVHRVPPSLPPAPPHSSVTDSLHSQSVSRVMYYILL